ncbi:MAG: N-acetylmuramoyl-L-alanine amidase [Myxococcaceae bacterium]
MHFRRALLVLSAAVFFIACEGAPLSESVGSKQAISTSASPLEAAFDRAATEYQVPVGVLKAMGYVETRLTHDAEASLAGGHGVMQLVKREDWNTLRRAAELTGVDEGRLMLDPVANIRGAAAVLRELADRSFAQYGDLNPSDPADFWHAVSLYAGLSSADLAQLYARDVYSTLENGFAQEREEGTIRLDPTLTAWRRHLPRIASRADGLKEYPDAYQWLQSPNYSAGHGAYSNILIHTTQGGYAGTLSWFRSTASGASSHYVIRSSDGQVTQMVEHKDTAWHVQCYNPRSIGIEHEGFVADPGRWYTDALYGASAKLTRWIADRHGMPVNRTTIIGHGEVPRSCNTNGHSDPGSGWNWTKYMALVNGSAPTPTSGVLSGAIYQNGSTANRVAGAVVTAGGKTFTTGADGLYTLNLPPGTYAVNVTKTGYASASVTRTVTAGATVWGSVEINTGGAMGSIKGVVYIINPADPADISSRIADATVTAGGKTVQSDPLAGAFSFTLPPGVYTLSVTKPGFATNSVSRQVIAGQTTWGSVGMSESNSVDQQAPALSIAFPADKAGTDVAEVTVSGTASDNMGPVGELTFKHNSGEARTIKVEGGAFTLPLRLAPGLNTLEISAIDTAKNVARAVSTATFHAGVSGIVHLADDPARAVREATVELRDSATGEVVDRKGVDAEGAFRLDSPKVAYDYVLSVTAAGYLRHAETVTIPEGGRLQVKLPVTLGEDVAPSEVGITLMDLKDGTVLNQDSVTLYGAVTGFEVASVTVNGLDAELVGAGGFSAKVGLAEGINVFEITAKGTEGQSVSSKLTLTRETLKSGCTALPGIDLGALVLVALPLLSRRRR